MAAVPGPAHSLYSTQAIHRFEAETLDQRREAYRIAHALADQVGLPLHGPAARAVPDALASELVDRRRRDQGGAPRVLREAYRAGKSIAAHLREERHAGANMIQLHRALREAFDISFGDAKGFVDDCRDSRNDSRLDAQLQEHPRS